MCIRDRNKTLTSMPTTQFSGAVVSYNASSRKVTAKEFVQDNLRTVSLIVGISFCVVLYIILRSLKKSKRAEEKSKKSAERALKLNQELEDVYKRQPQYHSAFLREHFIGPQNVMIIMSVIGAVAIIILSLIHI